MEKHREPRKGSRLVFLLYPFQGHINPMLQLATIMYSKGFSVTIVHPIFNSPDSSKHPEFTFTPISDNLSESKVSLGDFFGVIRALNKNCEVPLKECIEKMLEEQDSDDRVLAIIYDALMFFAQRVADHLKLPGISVRTSAAATILGFAVFPRGDEQGYISYIDMMSEEQETKLRALCLKDLAILSDPRIADVMLELRANLTNSMKKCSAVIVNTMDFLEQALLKDIQQLFATSIFTIGPFHKLAPTITSSLLKEDTNCISWLDRQTPNSVIYVSFGSMASMDEKELLEVAWGLSNGDQPFLWVVRPGLVRGSKNVELLLPKDFRDVVGEKGCIVEWAPQIEVLAHGAVGGFWTHCGWNSTLESVCEGVPMLCRPFFGDQKLNMRYVCDVWKVGVELENELERVNIERSVRRLMVDTQGEEMRKRAMHLKEKVELSLREGGSCYNSLNALAEQIMSSRSKEDGARITNILSIN